VSVLMGAPQQALSYLGLARNSPYPTDREVRNFLRVGAGCQQHCGVQCPVLMVYPHPSHFVAGACIKECRRSFQEWCLNSNAMS
jgi:hypothetical protein